MRKNFSYLMCVMMVLLMFVPSFSMIALAEENVKVWESEKDVPLDKTWTVTLNKPINANVSLNDLVYVLDEKGVEVPVMIAYSGDRKRIYVESPKEGYQANHAYTLIIEEGLQSEQKGKLAQTVHKPFKTGTKKEHNAFVPRADSSNKAVLKKGVIEVKEADIIRSVNKTTIELAATRHYEVGDLLALPPNADNIFGYFGKVINVVKNDDSYTLSITKPEMKEVLQDLDISKKVDVEAEDLILSDELTEPKVSAKYAKALGMLKPKVDVANTKKGIKISLSNVGYEIDAKKEMGNANISGSGLIMLDGSIEFEKPTANFDLDFDIFSTKPLKIGEASLSMDEAVNLNANLIGKASGEFDMELGTFAIPYASLGVGKASVGVVVNVYLTFSISLDGSVKVSLMQQYSSKVGVKTVNNKLQNASKMEKTAQSFNIPAIEMNVGMEAGFKLELAAEVAGYSLVDANIVPAFNVGIQANNTSIEDKLCVRTNLDIVLKYGLNVQDLDYSFSGEPIRYQIMKGGNCIVEDISFDEKEITVKPDKAKQLTTKIKLSDGTEKTLKLPSDQVGLKSNNSHVKVSNSGKVSLTNDAVHNEKAKITATYNNGDEKVSASIKINVVVPGDGIIEDIPYAKNYTYTNTSTQEVTISLEAGAHYVVYDQDLNIKQQSITSDTSLKVGARETAVISYKESPAKSPTVHNQVLKTNNDEAYRAMVFYRDANLTVKNRSKSPAKIFVEDEAKQAHLVAMTLGKEPTLMQKENVYYEALTLAGNEGSMHIKNQSSNESLMFVYVPTVAAEYDTESIPSVQTYVLKPSTTVSVKAKADTSLQLNGLQNQAYDIASFDKQNNVLYAENQKLAKPQASVSVQRDTNTIIENKSSQNITIVANNDVSFKKVDEVVFISQTVQPGESFSIRSTEPKSIYHSETEVPITYEAPINYDYVEFDVDENPYVKSFDSRAYSVGKNPTLDVEINGETLIQNTGNANFTISGLGHYLHFKQINEQLLFSYEIQPNQVAIMKAKENRPKYAIMSKYADNQVTGKNKISYNYAEYDEYGNGAGVGEIRSYPEKSTVYSSAGLKIGGETIVENIGSQPMTITAVTRYVEVSETLEKPLIYYHVKAGETALIKSKNINELQAVKNEDHLTYHYAAYNGNGGTSAHIEKEYEVYDFHTLTIPKDGEGIMKNTGTADIKLYGPRRNVTFGKTTEQPVKQYLLQPNEKVIVSMEEPNPSYGSSSFKIRGFEDTERIKYNYSFIGAQAGTWWSYDNHSIEGHFHKITSIKPSQKQIIHNNGTEPIEVYGPDRYINFEKTE